MVVESFTSSWKFPRLVADLIVKANLVNGCLVEGIPNDCHCFTLVTFFKELFCCDRTVTVGTHC